jgi:ankyrin repeat protein
VKLLLKNIDNLDRLEDHILEEYLKFAFDNNCLELLNSILESGQKDINHLFKTAFKTKNAEIFEYLLERIDDVNTVLIDGETLLTFCVKKGERGALLFILKSTNANPNLPNSKGESPLSLSRGNKILLKLLIKHGAHIDIFDAINLDSGDSKECTEKALEGNININEIHNSDGETPITFAIKNGKSEIVKLLLANGAHIDIFDAIRLDSLESVDFWARRAAQSPSFNEVNSDGETPLTFALKNNKSEIVKKLLNYGANTDKLSEIEKFKLLCIVENISAGRVDTLIEEIKGDDICPITLEQFTELKEPVLCTDGYIYEKAGIQAHWNSKGGSDSLGPSPTTRDQISIVSPRLNTALKSLIDKFQAEAPSPAPAPPAPAPAPLTATLKNKRSKKKKEKRTKRKKLRKDKKTESKDKKTGHKDTKRKDKKPERKDKKRKDKKTKGKHKRKA